MFGSVSKIVHNISLVFDIIWKSFMAPLLVTLHVL